MDIDRQTSMAVDTGSSTTQRSSRSRATATRLRGKDLDARIGAKPAELA
jgi:hypothetical protein